MATQIDETQDARLDVEPLSATIQITKRVYLDIRLTELDYEFSFEPTGIATFDKNTETIIGLQEGSTKLTIKAGALSKVVNVTVVPFETIDETTKKVQSVRDFQSSIRLIQDGKDLVDGASTNRPHNDTTGNIDKITAIEDTKELQSLGHWRNNVTYNTGDVVSFLSNIYQSKTNNNLGNTPIPPTMNTTDQYWQVVSNSNNILVKDYSILKRLGDNHILYHPTTNGKTLRRFKLEAHKTYILVKFSNLYPVKEQYGLYLDFSKYNDSSLEQDYSYPKVSYVEFEVLYKGLQQNCSGLSLPEINIKTCHRDTSDREVSYPIDGSFNNYGAYGLTLATALRRDKLITIMVTPAYDCEIILTGEYSVTPYVDSVNQDSVDSSYLEYINHLVRPGGGDLCKDRLGSLELYEKQLNVKQQWDKGLVSRSADVEVSATGLTLLHNLLDVTVLNKITEQSLFGKDFYLYTCGF